MHHDHFPQTRLSLALFVCLGFICVQPLWGAKYFTLQEARTDLTFGPYELIPRSHVVIYGHRYQMRVALPDRLSFISVSSGRVYGPVQTTEGRLLELSGKMYAFSWSTSGPDNAAVPAQPFVPSVRVTPPPLTPPPPAPEPIPIPPMSVPTPAKRRTSLPSVSSAWRTMAWIAPFDDVPMRWKVGGFSGRDTDLSHFTLGGAMMWNGWTASLGLSPSVSGGNLLPQGMSVQKAALDDGSGWALSLGYQRPFILQGGWQVVGGTRVAMSQDKLDLNSTTAYERTGTNDTVEVDYKSGSSSVTVTEFALWLDISLLYSQDTWGLFANLSLQPLGEIDVDGSLPLNNTELSIDAERDQPLAFGFGGWFGVSPWRGFADYTLGTVNRLRIGAMYDF